MNKSFASLAASLAALVCALAVTIAHAQTAEKPLQFERGYPIAGTAESSYDASDMRRAIEAYKFFFPTMGTEAVMQQMLSTTPRSTNLAMSWPLGHGFSSALPTLIRLTPSPP